jgi:hypothetical protein
LPPFVHGDVFHPPQLAHVTTFLDVCVGHAGLAEDGAPLPAAPPCIRHRLLPFTTGDRHGFPPRVRAPQRHARRKGKGSRVSRCKGLSAIFALSPTPGSRSGGDIADDGLGGFGEIDAEAIAPALIAAGHFGAGVAELFLHVALIDFGGAGETGPQGMACEFLRPFGFRQAGADAGGERRALDQPGDVPVGQPVESNLFATLLDPSEHRTVGDAREFEPGLEG